MVKNRVVVGVAIRVNAIDGLERDGSGGRVVSEYWRADDAIVVRPEGQVSVAEAVLGKERLKPRRVCDGRSRDIAARIDVKVLGVVKIGRASCRESRDRSSPEGSQEG